MACQPHHHLNCGKRKALYILSSELQNKFRLRKRRAASVEEGCGDSQDEMCTIQPRWSPPPFIEDASDSTEFRYGVLSSRCLVSSDYGYSLEQNLSKDTSGDSKYSVNSSTESQSESDANSSFNEFESISSRIGSCNSTFKGKKSLKLEDDESLLHLGGVGLCYMENEQRNRIQILSQAAASVNAGLPQLYHATCMFDACLEVARIRGRRIDSVQREILSLTCLFIVCQHQILYANFTSDEFCSLAGVAEQTVKGCMIENQRAMVESLLGVPSSNYTARQLWKFIRSSSQPSEICYMARFVVSLVRSPCGNKFISKLVLSSALHVLSRVSSNAVPSRVSLKIMMGTLCPPINDSARDVSASKKEDDVDPAPATVAFDNIAN